VTHLILSQNEPLMNFDRLTLGLLALYLLYLLYQQHRTQIRRLWQRSKDCLPRTWKPKSPRDCTCCQTGITLVPLPDPNTVVPWSQRKSPRGRKKTVDTNGFACPQPGCEYFGITDADIHALIGYGWIDQAQTIRKFCCQACHKTFSVRKGTPLYYLKTDPQQVEMVLWFLAEGLDQAVMIRFTGHSETTIARWLQRAGTHSQAWHHRYLRLLMPVVLQLDELYTRVRSIATARWLWLAIDPISKLIPALHLGGRTNQDAYSFLHHLTLSLEPGWIPLFLSDGLRAYFYAITAHFGRWFRPPRARTDHWQVDEHLLYGQLVKRKRSRKLAYAITRMLWGQRKALIEKLKSVGLSGLIQTAFIERVNLTLRQSVAPLMRKTWSLAQSEHALLMHVQWWRLYYHFVRDHSSLRTPVPGLQGRYRSQTPAMAAGLTSRVWTVGELLRTPIILPEM
jgi:IS1 family transposase